MMRSTTRRIAQLETAAHRRAEGPPRIVWVDAIDDPENVAQRLEDARREVRPNGMVIHVRRIDEGKPT